MSYSVYSDYEELENHATFDTSDEAESMIDSIRDDNPEIPRDEFFIADDEEIY